MKALRKHPAEALFGAQNAHILESLRTVDHAVEQLLARGFTVHGIEVRDRRPVVWVAACERCVELGGAAHVIRSQSGQRVTVMAAVFEGCQVQWVVN